jgi:lichenan operon transcriptional antiterminator
MKSHHIKMLRYLLTTSVFTTNDISEYLNVTTRSINNYINEINHIKSNTIFVDNNKYRINKENVKSILNQFAFNSPKTSDERVFFIIKWLFDNNTYDIYDLADELYVSYSTIKNDLIEARVKLFEHNLQLINKNDILSILGTENNKRKLICDILYSESSSESINNLTIFNNNDQSFIKNLILNILFNYSYFINDFSLNGLVLHLLITIERMKNGYRNEEKPIYKPFIKLHEYNITKEIIDKIEQKFDVEFLESDINETALLLVSRTNSFISSNINQHNLIDYVGIECINIVNEMIKKVNDLYYMDIYEKEFFIRLTIHVKNLLLRCKSNYFQRNPLKYQIEHDCPLIYETAVSLSNVITRLTNYKIPEDEIAFLAFHIGNEIEVKRNNESRLNAVIFCPSYYSLNNKISIQINDKFNDLIVITDVIDSEKKIESLDCDLIIGICNEYENILTIPNVKISPFFSRYDIMKINDKIVTLKHEKDLKEFSTAIKKYIKKSLFEISSLEKDKISAISNICDKLENLGYVNSDFKQNVLTREEISSTGFNLFAIPHSIEMDAEETCIYVKIIKSNLNWDTNKVKLIVMLCFNDKDKGLFTQVFESLAKILYKTENVKKLIKSNTYESFINELIDMYNL